MKTYQPYFKTTHGRVLTGDTYEDMQAAIYNPDQIRHQIASELADYMVKNDVIKFSKRYEEGHVIITGEVKVVK